MRACCALLLAIGSVGCDFTLNAASDANDPRDGHADTIRDGSDGLGAPQCFPGPLGVYVCIQGGLSGAIDVTNDVTIDTDSLQDGLPGTTSCASLAAGTLTAACVLAASTFTIEPTYRLSAHGSLPLIVL